MQEVNRREAIAVMLATTFFGTNSKDLSADQARTTPVLKVGDTLPEISLKDVDGKKVTLSEIGKDKIVLVEFWAVWCQPCTSSLPKINNLYADLHERSLPGGQKGFEVFGVALESDYQQWKALLEDKTVNWPYNVATDDLSVIRRFNVTQYPKNYLIDGSRKIIAVDVKDLRSEKIEELVKSQSNPE